MKFSDFQKNLQEFEESFSGYSYSDQLRNLEVILDIVKSISKSLILEDVLSQVLKSAIEITHSERGFIVLQNHEGSLEYKLGLSSNGITLPESLFEISTTVVQDVFRTGKSKFIESAQDDIESDPSVSIIKLQLQTILCSPLQIGERKIGVIYVDSKALRKIKIKEITGTFEILAGQAAIAIYNAQLYNNQLKAYKALQMANEELRKAKDVAEKSNKLKSEFLAQMSHEIRTPINIIFGFTSLLKEEFDEDQHEKHVETFDSISKAGKRIMNTVDTILEMSQIQTGNVELLPVIIDLETDIIFDVIREHKPSAEEKNIKFYFINEAEKTFIHSDRYMTRQIFNKIVDNAIKYTTDGEVRIRLFNEDRYICCEISDTGVGISEEYMSMLYTPFSQEETGYTRKFEGNGLGLAIAKKYVELNNAIIEVSSEKKKGSQFKIKFEISDPVLD